MDGPEPALQPFSRGNFVQNRSNLCHARASGVVTSTKKLQSYFQTLDTGFWQPVSDSPPRLSRQPRLASRPTAREPGGASRARRWKRLGDAPSRCRVRATWPGPCLGSTRRGPGACAPSVTTRREPEPVLQPWQVLNRTCFVRGRQRHIFLFGRQLALHRDGRVSRVCAAVHVAHVSASRRSRHVYRFSGPYINSCGAGPGLDPPPSSLHAARAPFARRPQKTIRKPPPRSRAASHATAALAASPRRRLGGLASLRRPSVADAADVHCDSSRRDLEGVADDLPSKAPDTRRPSRAQIVAASAAARREASSSMRALRLNMRLAGASWARQHGNDNRSNTREAASENMIRYRLLRISPDLVLRNGRKCIALHARKRPRSLRSCVHRSQLPIIAS